MLPMRTRTATVAVVTAAVAVALAGEVVQLLVAAADATSLPSAAVNGAPVLGFAVVGAVVTAARPRNAIGWLLLASGATWASGGAFVDLARHGIVSDPGSVPGASALAVSGSAIRSIGWYLVTIAVPVLYPTGQVLSERWRWLRPAVVVVLVTAVIDPITDPKADLTDLGTWHNPIGDNALAHLVISPLAFLGHVAFGAVVTVAAVVQLVQRYRAGDALTRQQVGLFAGGVALTLLAAPLALLAGAGGWVFGLAALPLPVAIGFAVLARGLYDLRSAANRTLVWVALSGSVAGAYALVIAGLGGLLHTDRHATWLPWVAAGVIAVLFAPLRVSLQRGVNRLTYGRWDEPYDVLAALGQRVEATADVDRLLDDVVTELAGLGLQHVSIRDARGHVVAGTDDGDEAVELTLSAYGEVVGALRYEQPTTPLRARDRRLLDDLGGHLGGLLHAQRLTRDLQAARERLVLGREEERRRLRRDLHDGLGPALAGHLLRLDVLSGRLRKDPVAAAEVDALREDLRTTVTEVRRVVEGLRPPALDELGLEGAVHQVAQRMLAGTSTQVAIEAHGVPALSAAVEVAAFRILTEAVTNVAKHARASTCRICLRGERGLLVLEVADDGRGTATRPSVAGGHGLHTMRERAEELRGRLRVSHRPGGGTTVVAELPLPRESAALRAAR
jgi:signal transduction histidine kinase